MGRLYVIFLCGILLPITVPPARATVATVWAMPRVQEPRDRWADTTRVALVALARHVQAQRQALASRSVTITINGTPVPEPAAAEPQAESPSAPVVRDTSPDFRLTHGQSLDAAAIDAILAEFTSPAAGTGAIWVAEGQRTGIDAAYVLAMFIYESTAGTHPAWAGHKPDGTTTHNVGNIICAGYATCHGGFRDYPDWQTGIAASFDLLADYRDRQGKQTIGEAIFTWAPPVENDTAAYVATVEELVTAWRQIQAAPAPDAPARSDRGAADVHPVTSDMVVTAPFDLVNCAYWGSQPGCQHFGTDYALVDGQPVYAPVAGTFVTAGAYPEGDPYLRTGAYAIYLTDDGYELYAGHLTHVPDYQPGQRIAPGDVLGYGRGDLAHTHIQLRTPARDLVDFERYYRRRQE